MRSSKKDGFEVIVYVIQHTMIEFVDMEKYFILGSFISALIQALLPSKSLLTLGQGGMISILIMMILVFALSICSEADAFIAKTFRNTLSNVTILSFLTFGFMLDIKNTFMIFGNIGRKFAIKLSLIITCYHILLGYLFNSMGLLYEKEKFDLVIYIFDL